MALTIRSAQTSDAQAMCDMINPIIAKGGTTAHRDPFDTARMIAYNVSHPRGISCVVADDGGTIAGFQSLEWADPDPSATYHLPVGWAIIASFVALTHHGQGVGRQLFAQTLAAARQAGVRCIDATIRLENTGGQAFYARMGFVDYKTSDVTVSKKLELAETLAAGG